MSDSNDEKIKKSNFNEASFQIVRLNYLWVLCNESSSNGKLNTYKWALDRVWMELSSDAYDVNEKKYRNGMRIFNTAISKAKNKSILYAVLQEKEIFLRRLQEKVGKGGKKTEIEEW